jgi:CspA family cold shock protein
MQGTMLWFNAEKGYGYIETEHAERLYVARSGFQLDHEPKQRCKGKDVSFDRVVAEGDIRAVNVTFLEAAPQQRARLRTPRSGRSL